MSEFLFCQLTIDARDPMLLARFWAQVLGWQPAPPSASQTPWYDHYRRRLGDRPAFEDRLFDPEGLRPPIWFQQVPEGKAGKNRLHLDVYPSRRDPALSLGERMALVEAKVEEVVELGARVLRRERQDDPQDPDYYVVVQDPEGNEFCVG
jgi:hypothetical protein